jgi:hypothetical protein
MPASIRPASVKPDSIRPASVESDFDKSSIALPNVRADLHWTRFAAGYIAAVHDELLLHPRDVELAELLRAMTAAVAARRGRLPH